MSNFPSLPVQNESDSDSVKFSLWEEPYKQARKWKPCAAKHSLPDEGEAFPFKQLQLVSLSSPYQVTKRILNPPLLY
jgi:hypothetical protein